MASPDTLNLREKLPPDIVKGAKLDSTINELFKNFEAGKQKNAELVNKFFDQNYFKGEESLINKLIEVDRDIKFDDIADEGINLALLQYGNWLYDLKDCLDKISSDEIKTAIIKEIHAKIQAQVAGVPGDTYRDFDDADKCGLPGDTNVLGYFQKVVEYLQGKEGNRDAKNTSEILKDTIITNNDINNRLIASGLGNEIPAGANLRDPSIPQDTKDGFDTLLSFEIGKEADRTINIVTKITDKLGGLFSNSFPAINTIISESPEYKYEESRLGPDFEQRKQAINNDSKLTSLEKKEKINDLKRELYIKFLKTRNSKIGNAMEQLYNNNFDYSKLDPNTLKDYIDKVVDLRIKKLYDDGMNTILKIDYVNMDAFKNFYKNLAYVDPSNPSSTIHLTNVSLTNTRAQPFFDIPIHKTIVKGENPRLKDIEQYSGSAKAFDAIPFNYEINQKDIDNLDISMEDRTKILKYLSRFKTDNDKYIIEGKDVGMLIYLFFIVNNRTSITTLDPDKQKLVEDAFGKVKASEKKEIPNDAESFKEVIEKMGTGVKFEDGAEIWMPMGDSDLPGGGYQWMRVKISDVDMKKGTFKGRVFGGELKFGDKLEGKSRTFDMNDETIKKFKEISKDPNKIRLLPSTQKTDFNSFRNSLNRKLGNSDLIFPVKGTTWDGDKFMQKITDEDGKEKEVEVKYFGTQGDNKSVYKIEYNPGRNCFHVSSAYNGKEKGKNGKSENKRFQYSRDMDWNNFLIFFTQKGLTPQTEDEANDIINQNEQELRMVNGGNRKLNWFSVNNIKNAFKALKGNIKKKMDDYNKRQDEKLEDILIGDRGLYRNLAGVLGFIPSMKEGLGELEQEYYNERDNRTWKKIDAYLKIFQADPDFGTTFDQIPPHAKIQGGRSLQRIVLDRVKNAKDRIGDPGIYQAAALLLANYDKGGSPYRGLAAQENSGLWVKALLGKAHYEQFMRDKAKLIRARDEAENGGAGDKKGLNETLASCEMKYIINNIRGSYKGLITGSYEERGIPGTDNTNYIDNPSKRLLSDQFAKKLEDAYKGRFTKGSVKGKYDKFTDNNSFDEMENEFGKTGSTRYQIGEAALRRMIDLATTDDLKKRMKKHFLTYLLSGALDINCDPGVKKQVYGWAKPMMFVPGLLVKEAGVADNIAVLLDDATNGDFSKHVTKYFHQSGQLSAGTDFKGLQKEMDAWLTNEKMDTLDNYFSNLQTIDLSKYEEPKRSILQKYQNAMSASNREEADRGILDNAKVVSNGLLSSAEVVKKRMAIKNGEFDGKDIDENNNMKDFRKNVTKDINKRSTEPRQVAFVLDKFFNRFGIDDQQVYEWVLTADFWDTKRGPFILPYKGIELNMGNIGDKEINSILWYAFQGNARRAHGLGCDRLPDELFDALQAFQNYFSKAFYNRTLLKGFKPKSADSSPLLIGSRDVYDQSFAGDSEYQFMDNSVNDDDLSSGDKDKANKAKKKKRKELLKSTDFINSDIVNIEKQFKKNLGGTSRQFPQVTSSNSRTLREEYLRGRLAA